MIALAIRRRRCHRRCGSGSYYRSSAFSLRLLWEIVCQVAGTLQVVASFYFYFLLLLCVAHHLRHAMMQWDVMMTDDKDQCDRRHKATRGVLELARGTAGSISSVSLFFPRPFPACVCVCRLHPVSPFFSLSYQATTAN